MKRFILIDHEPWTVRRKELFYDLFEKAGIPIEVWDLSQWLHPGLHNPDEISDAPYLCRVKNEIEYQKLIDNVDSDNSIIVEQVFRNWENRKVYKYIGERNIQTIGIDLYANTNVVSSLSKKLKKIKWKSIKPILRGKFYALLFSEYKRIHKIKNPIRFFSSSVFCDRTTPINHPDYENFKFNQSSRIIKEPYILFCDIYFPYHTDLKYFYKLNKLPDGKKYQQQLKNFFDYLESTYHLPVIIAAHPKADYNGNEFGNRKIIKYQTDNLVAGAEMIALHLCNTISYVLLNDKPLAFIATDDYLSIDHVRRRFPIVATEALGKKIYNLDKVDLKNIEFKKVDPKLRNQYIYSYLTSKDTEMIENTMTLKTHLSVL